MTISVLIASSGRPTLINAIESVVSQLRPGDELIVDVNDDAPWGHEARNRMMPRAKGDFLLFTDDDDTVAAGALSVIRAAVERAPNSAHIFKMAYSDGRTIWTDPEVRLGNVSTQMIVCPNVPPLAVWREDLYEGDFHFIKSTCDRRQTVFHEQVIAHYRPS